MSDAVPHPILRLAADPDDRAAWTAAVAAYGGLCWRIALRMLRDEDDAADAVQDCLLDLRAAARRFRPGPDPAGAAVAWVARIAVNTCHAHRRRRRPADALPSDLAAPPAVEADAETLDQLHAAIAALPDNQREAVELRYLAELDYDQVGAALRIAPGAARVRVHRALEALHEGLAQRGVALSVVAVGALLDSLARSAVLAPATSLTAAWSSTALPPVAAATVSTGALIAMSILVAAGLAVTLTLAEQAPPTPLPPAPAPAPDQQRIDSVAVAFRYEMPASPRHRQICGLAFDPAGTRLVIGSHDGVLRAFAVGSWASLPDVRVGHGYIWRVGFAGDALLAGCNEVVAIPPGAALPVPIKGAYKLLAMSADGRRIATGVGISSSWTVSNTGLQVSGDLIPGSDLAIREGADWAEQIVLPVGRPASWDENDRKLVESHPELASYLGDKPEAACFDRAGRRLFTSASCSISATTSTTSDEVDDVAVATATVAVRANEPYPEVPADIGIWDTATGRRLGRLVGHTFTVRGLTMLPDDKRLLSYSADGTARLWDVAKGREIWRLPAAGTCAIDPQGQRAAVALKAGINLIELADGKVVTSWPHLMGVDDWGVGGVTNMAFSPDGRWLAAVGWGGALMVWSIPPAPAVGSRPTIEAEQSLSQRLNSR